jgi:hypothetical protein
MGHEAKRHVEGENVPEARRCSTAKQGGGGGEISHFAEVRNMKT